MEHYSELTWIRTDDLFPVRRGYLKFLLCLSMVETFPKAQEYLDVLSEVAKKGTLTPSQQDGAMLRRASSPIKTACSRRRVHIRI